MFHIIWSEIKDFIIGNTKVFILSILAFTCSCVAINITLTNYSFAKAEQKAAEENYGDKSYYKITFSGDNDVFRRIFGLENTEQLKAIFDALKEDDLFQYRYSKEESVWFYNDDDDPTYNADKFPAYKNEFVDGYEEGSQYDNGDIGKLPYFLQIVQTVSIRQHNIEDQQMYAVVQRFPRFVQTVGG